MFSSNEFKDYYAILGVDRSADLKAIKKAYRTKALDSHPDKQADLDGEEMKKLNEAYQCLQDEDKRREYNLYYDEQNNNQPNRYESSDEEAKIFEAYDNNDDNNDNNNNNSYSTFDTTPTRNTALSLLHSLYRDITVLDIQTNEDSLLDKLKKQIFDKALNILEAQNESNTSQLLDLYFTIHTVIKICKEEHNPDNFQYKVADFFKVREHLLRGDSHDYCYAPTSAANIFCSQLAHIIFPRQSINNVLLSDTLKRNKPWVHPDDWKNTNLPAVNEWFRTPNNRVHLYAGVVQQAIVNLYMQCEKLSDVWFGTDNASPDNTTLDKTDNKDSNSLTSWDLRILKQRSPTLKMLIEYTEFLQIHNEGHPSIYSHLNELRLALNKGQKKNNKNKESTGTEEEAGSEVNIAVAKFAEWWNGLKVIEGGREIRRKLAAIRRRDNGQYDPYPEFRTLGDRLKYILNPNVDHARDYHARYCVAFQAEMLEGILSDPINQEEIRKIDNTFDIHWKRDYLDQLQKQIRTELKCGNVDINTGRDLFSMLSNLPGFLEACVLDRYESESLDLFRMHIIANMSARGLRRCYNFFEPKDLGIVLCNLINDGEYDSAKELIAMRPESVKSSDDKVIFAAICFALENGCLDPELIFSLCKNPNIFAHQDNNGKGVLELVADKLCDLEDADGVLAQNARQIMGSVLTNFPGKLSPNVLENALATLINKYEYQLAQLLLEKRPDILSNWPSNKPHPIFEYLDQMPKFSDPLFRMFAGSKSTFQAVDANGKNILLNAVLANNYYYVKHMLKKCLDKFEINQLKHAVFLAVDTGQDTVVRLFLDLVDNKGYEAMFTSRMVEFIVTSLIQKGQFDLAKDFLVKRPECLTLKDVEDMSAIVGSKKSKNKQLSKLLKDISKTLQASEKDASDKKSNSSGIFGMFGKKREDGSKHDSKDDSTPAPIGSLS